MSISFFLTILSGISWTIVYIDGLRLGLRDKSYAMPLWALGLNISWELIHFVLGARMAGYTPQVIINGIWFLFDIGLIYTYFRFGHKYFPKGFKPVWFYVWGTLVLMVTFTVQVAFVLEFDIAMAATYAAYLQNLLMSVLFIQMLLQRGNREGQSMMIAVCKFIGSLAPTISFGVLGGGPFSEPLRFVLIIGALMAVFDLIYIVMLAKTLPESSSAPITGQ